jgi:hypothetical protein
MQNKDNLIVYKGDLELYNEILNFQQSVARLITHDDDDGAGFLSHPGRNHARLLLSNPGLRELLTTLPQSAYEIE